MMIDHSTMFVKSSPHLWQNTPPSCLLVPHLGQKSAMGEGAATAIAMTTSPREDGGKDGGKAAAALAEDRGEAAAAALADPSGPKFVAALVGGLLSMSIKLFAVIIREGGTLASCVGSEDDDTHETKARACECRTYTYRVTVVIYDSVRYTRLVYHGNGGWVPDFTVFTPDKDPVQNFKMFIRVRLRGICSITRKGEAPNNANCNKIRLSPMMIAHHIVLTSSYQSSVRPPY